MSRIIDLVLSYNMFIQNLSNNNWTGQSISNILETKKNILLNYKKYKIFALNLRN